MENAGYYSSLDLNHSQKGDDMENHRRSIALAFEQNRRIEKARVVFTRAVIAALETGTALPAEVEIEEVVGGFTVKNANGFFVVTVQKAG
jgi:hypothetical protein